jgi:hypothetical protein
MKALFVLYPDDPPEYFEQLHLMQDKVFAAGGHCSVDCKIYTDWKKPPRVYLEYKFETNTMEELV